MFRNGRSNGREKLWPSEIGTQSADRARKIGRAANGGKIVPGGRNALRELSGPISPENTASMS